MQKVDNLIQLGDFVLDLTQQLLYLDAVEIAIEPKVMELLIYLYQQGDRYVGIEELHQNVWADRVVSDTAVRSAIKKLRILLGDHDLANPHYIKSVSKRGYKLICVISQLDKPVSSSFDSSIAGSLLQARGGYAPPAVLANSDTKKVMKSIVVWSCVLISFCLLLLWFGSKALPKSDIQLSEIQPLTEFNGEKLSLAVSANGRYIAFTGRTSPDQDRQVYLFDKQSQQTRQLTTKATNAAFVNFVQNDKALIYSNSVNYGSSLHLLPLTIAEPESAMVTLLEGKNIIGQIEQGRTPSEIIFVMAESAGSSVMVYSFDINSTELERLVSVSRSDEHLYGVALSPDKGFLALLKQSKGEYQILVHDLEQKHEVNVQNVMGRISNILWHNNHQLIVLDDDAISLLDIKSREVEPLYANTGSLISAMTSHDGTTLAVAKKAKVRADRLYIEQDLSAGSETTSIVNTDSEVVSMSYGDISRQKWVTLLKNNVHSVARLNTQNQKTEEVFRSKKNIELLDVAQEQQLLLLKEGERLLLVSASNGEVRYLVSSSASSSDGIFSRDGKQVLFGTQIGDQWEIQQFNLAELTSSTLLKGYKSIRLAKQGYVVADERGELFHYVTLEDPPVKLNHRIGFEFINRWYVKQNKVIWTTFDYRLTYLHQLDLFTNKYEMRQSQFFSLYPRISVNAAADRILYLSVQLNDTSLETMSVISE